MPSKGRTVKEKARILWISDAVAHTGFATVAHGVLDNLYQKYDVHVLAINYFGDPHQYPYSIYPASVGGDVFGIRRLPALYQQIKPHLVVLLNDPWIVKDYLSALDKPVGKNEKGEDVYPHKIAYMPVDGLNLQKAFVTPLNALELAIGYTQFAVDQLRASGLTTKTEIIPHGIDLNDFHPTGQEKARSALNNLPSNWFVVGCVNRNQPRKRIDLLIQYFAEWVKDKPENVKLYFHGALQDVGWDVLQLAEFHGIGSRFIISSPHITPAVGVPRNVLGNIYNSFDVQVSTTAGEGWGLTQMEGMACGIPQIVPDWSGLGEWTKGAAHLVPCTALQAHTGGLNTIGGIADKALFIEALNRMYFDQEYRREIGKAGHTLVTQPKFRWSNVAQRFDAAFQKVMYASN